MAIWQRYSHAPTVVTAGDHSNLELLHNQATSDDFQSADLVIVDGIVVVNTDTDNLCGVRLLVADEIIQTANLSEVDPEDWSDMIYYSWFAARGPLVFRLRSKRTLHPEEKLWSQVWKEQGGDSTICRVGYHLYVQRKD